MILPVKKLQRATGSALVIGLLGLLMACGSGTYVDKRTKNPFGPGPGQKPGQSDSGQPIQQNVPVDTFLASSSIPSRLKSGPELILRFRSNLETATFECSTSVPLEFKSCPGGNSFTFSGLVHGRGYQLQVRAVRSDGFADASPLVVSFVVDNVDGLPPQDRPGTDLPTSVTQEIIHPVSPSDLPMPVSGGAGQRASRKLQIGSTLVLDVPPEFLVTSYATTKTYNNAMHLMRIMGADTGTSLFAEEPCNREFERIVAGPAGFSYCDATPTREQWINSYAARIPHNHLEIVRNGAAGPEEKFFAAGFDEEQDPAEFSIGIESLCRGAVTRGQTRGPLAQGFFAGETVHGIIEWCQIKDRHGNWWWLGSADLNPTNSGLPIRARLIYTLAHQPAVYSGPRFATRFSERSTKLLSKLTDQ